MSKQASATMISVTIFTPFAGSDGFPEWAVEMGAVGFRCGGWCGDAPPPIWVGGT